MQEFYRQPKTESQNGGAAAPQRNTERVAINSTTNGITKGGGSQPPIQTTWARQANIGKLQAQLAEEWKTKLEEEKRKHNLELEQLKREVRIGNRDREIQERKI